MYLAIASRLFAVGVSATIESSGSNNCVYTVSHSLSHSSTRMSPLAKIKSRPRSRGQYLPNNNNNNNNSSSTVAADAVAAVVPIEKNVRNTNTRSYFLSTRPSCFWLFSFSFSPLTTDYQPRLSIYTRIDIR
ncbi:unnamed protein product [Aphis gossypii]|uniref:Secreted protein n=1 Tax=Aphis gossypii TaxID=80765 RepID=A0A9P0JBN8_APHGO|nr:unnamed protein product [Aphis gossypii]